MFEEGDNVRNNDLVGIADERRACEGDQRGYLFLAISLVTSEET